MAEEQLLSGGELTRVVRVDGTVRRPVGPWTDAVHSLLRHLEDKGFEKAPRVLGIDDQNREILTYIPGETVGTSQPWPGWAWSETTLGATANWLREYHHAVADYREKPGAIWRMNWAGQGENDIICHFDVAPYNLVLGSDGEITVIDWDVAAPGSRLLELGKVANSFCGVSDIQRCRSLGCKTGELNEKMLEYIILRIELLLDVYDLKTRAGFVDMMLAAASHSRDRIRRGAAQGDMALRALVNKGVVDQLQRTFDLYGKYRARLVQEIED